ncbi:MAG: TIGR03986 family CRISPR-associated RAMP protein [Calditrichaeota bacterium]|nr:MAG: TIGR03986 family CRISPR-associated RAMP protein [Calditrichota bacterium]
MLKHDNPERSRIDRRGRVYKARAPYNFVPLPDKVVSASTVLDQDRFHTEARNSDPVEVLSGYIDCDLETCSPVYVRGMLPWDKFRQQGNDDEKKKNYKDQIKNNPDFFHIHAKDKPVIPGSTLRGMVRNVIEIIAHGRLRWVSDAQKFNYRAVAAPRTDPLSEPYSLALGKFGSRVKAGYLLKMGSLWYIQPAKTPEQMRWPERSGFLTVPERKIGGRDIANFMRFNNPGYKPAWHAVGFEMQIRRARLRPVDIVQIGQPPQRFTYQGVLVCSGNMLETQTNSKAQSPRKNHTLILPRAEANPLAIPQQVMDDYLINMTTFQKENLVLNPKEKNNKWYNKDQHELINGAPVFYVNDGKNILYFGHCPNFRVPALNPKNGQAMSTKDFIPEVALGSEEPDIVDALFGWTDDDCFGPKKQYAGRLSFGDAHFVSAQEKMWQTETAITPSVLASPSPSTFQHYFVQNRTENHDPDIKANLANYTTPPGETAIRGQKFYWHKGTKPKIEATEKELKHQTQLTHMRPLNSGVRFSFRIHFENLRQQELGALLWALALPGQSGRTYRHKLGMGKPLGMGAVALTPRLYVCDRKRRYRQLFSFSGDSLTDAWEEATTTAAPEQYMQTFETFMIESLGKNTQATRFSQLERIRLLLLMLSWPGPNPRETRYMEIEHSEGRDTYNEYAERPVLPDPAGVMGSKVARPSEPEIQEETELQEDVQVPTGYKSGKVLEFNLGPFKDYGFIQPDAGSESVFVHKNHLAPGVYQIINEDRVHFRTAPGISGRQEARDVKIAPSASPREIPEDATEAQSSEDHDNREREPNVEIDQEDEPDTSNPRQDLWEEATVMKMSSKDKAQVKNQAGEVFECGKIPATVRLQEGDTVIAEVVRSKNEIIRAVFKQKKE